MQRTDHHQTEPVMITIRSNTQQIIGDMAQNLGLILNSQEMMKAVATGVLPVMRKRVHEDGLDSNGAKIGTYSPGYMKVRTGNYGNSGTYKRGPKKGQPKDSGNYTKGKHKGSPRPKYNRTADTTVIGSLTREMENDMVAIPTDQGYGIGYTREDNLKKAQYLDATYEKKILTKLTEGEEELAHQIAADYVEDITKQL